MIDDQGSKIKSDTPSRTRQAQPVSTPQLSRTREWTQSHGSRPVSTQPVSGRRETLVQRPQALLVKLLADNLLGIPANTADAVNLHDQAARLAAAAISAAMTAGSSGDGWWWSASCTIGTVRPYRRAKPGIAYSLVRRSTAKTSDIGSNEITGRGSPKRYRCARAPDSTPPRCPQIQTRPQPASHNFRSGACQLPAPQRRVEYRSSPTRAASVPSAVTERYIRLVILATVRLIQTLVMSGPPMLGRNTTPWATAASCTSGLA
jgi:hypothetical protein